MARQIDSLVVIKGELMADTPIHVGGAGGAVDTDLPLALDGSGRYYIPGTNLAGAIRSWLDRADCSPKSASGEDDDAPGQGASREIWGHGRRQHDVKQIALDAGGKPKQALDDGERAGKKKFEGIASRVIVHDAYVINGNVAPEIRDHVGIDRSSGTAANGIKYDRQILPKGTRLSFSMEVELAKWESARAVDRQQAFKRCIDDDRRRIATALDALCNGRIRFGGAKTRGLGRLRLDRATVTEHNTKSPRGILDLVRGRQGAAVANPISASAFVGNAGIAGQTNSPPTLRITVNWQQHGPVMVKSSSDGVGVDMLPLVSGIEGGKLAMVIPGSAIKGRLRSQAERIALTLGLDQPQAPATAGAESGRDKFLKQLGRAPLVTALFGIPGPKKRHGTGKDAETKGLGLGAIMIDDCFAESRSVEPKQWQKLVAAPKDENDGMRYVRGALREMGWAKPGADPNRDNPRSSEDPAAHVAIDRWTGGAADGMLYSALEPRGVTWPAIEIEVALDRLKAPPQTLQRSGIDLDGWRTAAVALLFLTLRDFALGRVPLGFGGNRGYGSVKVTQIELHVTGSKDGPPDSLMALDGLVIKADGCVAPDANKLEGIQKSWSRYVKDWRDRVQKASNAGPQQ